MKPVLIRNAHILSGQLITNKPSDLLLRNGKIERISDHLQTTSEFEILDADGMMVTPGWIDIQLNGAFGQDFTENPESIWQAARELPRLGTTSFLPTIITSPLGTVETAIEILGKGPPPGFRGSHALGLHLEGPFLNPAKKGAHNPRYLKMPSPSLVEKWSRSNGVFLVTLAPELDENFATIHRLREQGVVVSAGHSLATYEQATEAFQQGIQCGTHLFNAQPGIEHRKPGLAVAILESNNICTGVIVDGIHMHPSMVNLAWKCKGVKRFITVTDAISALGMPPGKYNLGDFEINVSETTVTLADGTLAGSTITQQKSLQNLMAWTGCTLFEAVQTVTETPAELFDLPHKGKIVAGADADLVLVDNVTNIIATIVGGEILFKAF